jgi:hypothetical protein
MRRAAIVDGRNALDPATLIDAGFDYVGFGRQVGRQVQPTPIAAASEWSERLGQVSAVAD